MPLNPLNLSLTIRARAEYTRILLYLDSIDSNIADRFEARFASVCAELCGRLPDEIVNAGRPFDPPDESATLYFARPVFRAQVQTGKKRQRRSSTGLWYVYYVLTDERKSGKPDTIVVYAIQHSAAAPLSLDDNAPPDDESEAE